MSLPAAVEYIVDNLGAAFKSLMQGSNRGMSSASTTLNADAAPTIVQGTVIRSGPGFYDVVVNVPSRGEISCCMLASVASNFYGVSECTIPIEGTRVLVYLAQSRMTYGIVLGVVPAFDKLPPTNKDRTKSYKGFSNIWELECNATSVTESAYSQPLFDKKNFSKVSANGTRPLDILPGMYALMNEQQVGLAVTPLAATMKATSRAQVRVSAIDDNVRIVSGFYQHFNAGGSVQHFNDGGLISEEISVTGYQCEAVGTTEIGKKAFLNDAEKTLRENKSKVTRLKNQKDKMVPKKRLQIFMGYLGDLINMFIAKPDPDFDPETADDENKDQGLMHIHTDASGRISVRSASGIMLERWDRIPIPKRLKQPWDPKGDKVEDGEGEPKEKKPFEWDKEHPYGRALQLRDANAWRNLGAYWRLHNQSKSEGKKDFYLPEEEDLKVPDNEYDKPGKGTEEYKKYDKRQACMGIEEDGSIILRDAWGSELIMRGGNIIINAAAQIEVKSGKSTIILAGHDAVIRARQSVDVIATEHDVRLKAEKNLHMLAEGRESGGSILLESGSKSEAMSWDSKGEQVHGSGIVLKAKDSRVFLQGNKVHMSGAKEVITETFSEDTGKNEGLMRVTCGRIQMNAEQNTLIGTGNHAGVYLSPNSAFVLGTNAYLIGGSGAGVIKGAKYAVPMMWADIDKNVYAEIQPGISEIAEYLQSGICLAPYEVTNRKSIRFTYRSSEEYGTLKATEIEGGTKFYIYQPFWAFMAQAGSERVPQTPEEWEEYEIEGTMPWPGKEAVDGSYVKLEEEKNVTSESGIAKKRSSLKSKGGTLTPGSFDEYEVIPHS